MTEQNTFTKSHLTSFFKQGDAPLLESGSCPVTDLNLLCLCSVCFCVSQQGICSATLTSPILTFKRKNKQTSKQRDVFYIHIKINQLQTWKDTSHIYNKLLYKIAFMYIYVQQTAIQ